MNKNIIKISENLLSLISGSEKYAAIQHKPGAKRVPFRCTPYIRGVYTEILNTYGTNPTNPQIESYIQEAINNLEATIRALRCMMDTSSDQALCKRRITTLENFLTQYKENPHRVMSTLRRRIGR